MPLCNGAKFQELFHRFPKYFFRFNWVPANRICHGGELYELNHISARGATYLQEFTTHFIYSILCFSLRIFNNFNNWSAVCAYLHLETHLLPPPTHLKLYIIYIIYAMFESSVIVSMFFVLFAHLVDIFINCIMDLTHWWSWGQSKKN